MVTVPVDAMEKEYVYKTTEQGDVKLLFYPPTVKKKTPAPVFVIIPGGGWNASVPIDMYNFALSSCVALRAEGFAVASLSYRNHKEHGVNMIQILSDIFDGAGFLSKHADVLEIDPQRMYTSGHSAGGHLALMLSYSPSDFLSEHRDYADCGFNVVATAPMSPPTMLSKSRPLDYMAFDVEYLFENLPEEDYLRCSPEYMAVNGKPVPSQISVGSLDDLVFPSNGIRLHEKLTELNIHSELIVSEGGGHCFEPKGSTPAVPDRPAVLDELTKFILSFEK